MSEVEKTVLLADLRRLRNTILDIQESATEGKVEARQMIELLTVCDRAIKQSESFDQALNAPSGSDGVAADLLRELGQAERDRAYLLNESAPFDEDEYERTCERLKRLTEQVVKIAATQPAGRLDQGGAGPYEVGHQKGLHEDLTFITGPDFYADVRVERVAVQVVDELNHLAAHHSKEGDWRPIDTAPKDGTRIIGWVPAYGEAKIIEYKTLDFGADWRIAGGGYSQLPTHWMPLPTAPKTNGEGV